MTNDQQQTQTPAFSEWAILELFGHRRVAGHVSEVQVAGAGMYRVDIPAADGHPAQTHFYAPAAVYGLHPVAEDVARAAAERFRPQPISRWELPAGSSPEARPLADVDVDYP